MVIVDGQVHICTADSRQPPWPPGSNTFMHQDVPSSAEALLARMSAAGVDRAILVPPTWETDGNALAVRAALDHPNTFTVVGRVDLSNPAWEPALAAWPQPGMSGYRVVFARPHEVARYEDGTAERFLSEAEQRGIPIMMFVWGDLTIASAAAERHPDLRILLDHMCLPASIKIDEAGPLIDEMLTLATYPNVAIKASALPCNATDEYPYKSVHETIYRVVDAFGPNRVFWGTDMTRLPCTYAQSVTMFTEELTRLNDSELELIMGRGLMDWFNWA